MLLGLSLLLKEPSYTRDVAGNSSKIEENTSKNKGFNYYRETGEISDSVAQKFFEQPEYKKFLSYLK